MKAIATTLLIGTAMLALSACANTKSSADYSYESQAPYASERTVGDTDMPSHQAEKVFTSRQRK